ncbi:hypothetical protein Tco_0707690 [Tanacetum coccineum]|uniref:Uncharacterized protein n=1 Tax=Tanacetum coccineum TaxID=301880 RepID=A0ABQ4YAW1_9ASTR
MDALALTPCYPAFLITADAPEVYMHQFWNCIYKHDDFYRFKIDKKKRFRLTLEVFREILQICPRVQGQDFDPLPSEEDTVSFLRDLGHSGVINSLNDVVVDQMHQPWRTFAALINRSLSGKTTGLDKLRLSRSQIIWEASQRFGAVLPDCLTSPEMKESKAYKTYLGFATGKRVKRAAKKSSTTLATGIIIRESPVTTKAKGNRKENVDVAHGKGIEQLSNVALTEEA